MPMPEVIRTSRELCFEEGAGTTVINSRSAGSAANLSLPMPTISAGAAQRSINFSERPNGQYNRP